MRKSLNQDGQDKKDKDGLAHPLHPDYPERPDSDRLLCQNRKRIIMT
ncbi:MAG: hypothetical protein HQK62_10260 [Desulfamplus sp.]|nr:hypothetical protein [Desulfamplus sp.]MBF0259203.1 hypothetical protein [Desulfamplus sp.]